MNGNQLVDLPSGPGMNSWFRQDLSAFQANLESIGSAGTN